MKSMANVLNEFLHGISKGFADAAFATFKRRRSTVRSDISQSFSDDADNKGSSAAAAYESAGITPKSSKKAKGNLATRTTGGVKGSANATPKSSSYDSKLKEMGMKEL